jgi:hypothetical protein
LCKSLAQLEEGIGEIPGAVFIARHPEKVAGGNE